MRHIPTSAYFAINRISVSNEIRIRNSSMYFQFILINYIYIFIFPFVIYVFLCVRNILNNH